MMSSFPGRSPFVLVSAGIVALGAAAHVARAQGHEQPVPGVVRFPVSCSDEAQAEFRRAVALLHHMTYPRAREGFLRVREIDPGCAMAEWGIAMTLFQPLWPTRPGLAERQRGWDAVQRGLQAVTIDDRERLLLAATAAFFEHPDSTDYWQRIHRWEQAMARAHAAYPQDPEITAFYALAHIAAAPPMDDSVAVHSARAAELLLEVYRQDPSHPGAMHYLVHANDAPGRANLSLDVTHRYETAAPRNPHALHMPTHIYTRLGDWDAVIRGNRLAAEAALAQPAGDSGQYVWDEFPHAIEYLVYAYLQQGADVEAAAQLERLHATGRLEPTFKTAFHLASTRARYALERRAWREAAALVPREAPGLPWDRFTWPAGITWFARGLGAAHEGRVAEARASVERLDALAATATSAGEDLFARNLRILATEVRAWLAHAEGDEAASRALAQQAAELEVSTPKHAVTPAPILPAHELWADLLLEQGDGVDALAQYRTSLSLHPRRFNSLIGAARAAVAVGDTASARRYYGELLTVAGTSSRRAALDEARRFMARR